MLEVLQQNRKLLLLKQGRNSTLEKESKLRKVIKAKCFEFRRRLTEECSHEKVKLAMVVKYKQWLCRNDLFFLTCITGHEKIAEWGDFYKPFCDDVSLMNWKVVDLKIQPASEEMPLIEEVDALSMQRLYLRYRGYYKTTIVTIVHSAQLLLNFPNIHILLCHNKQSTSSDNLVSVRSLFQEKVKLSSAMKEMLQKEYGVTGKLSIKDVFPQCIPPGKEWGNSEEFSLHNREDKQRPEENVTAVGVDTEITGGHWQIAKKNDLVTEKSVNTEEQISKTLDWDSRFNKGHFDQLNQQLQDYEGTRYHQNDLYSIKKNDSRINVTEVSIVKDLEKFEAGDDSQIVHPERYNRLDIESLMLDEEGRRDMWVFNCQLMLKPEDKSRMQFNEDMIKYFSSIPDGCFNYLLIDPATAKKKQSDYTVMLVVGVLVIDDKVCKFIIDGIRDKIDTKKRVDTAFEFAKKYKVKDIGWEAIGFQETDCFYFKEKARKDPDRIPVPFEIKSHVGTKEDRIRGLIPEYSNGEWFWPEKDKVVKRSEFFGNSYDLTDEMELEMNCFPLAKHDDLLDAMTFLNRLNITKPVQKTVVEESNDLTFADYHKMNAARGSKGRWENKVVYV